MHCVADGKGAFACVNPVGGELNVKLAKCVRDNGTLLLFANLGSNTFQARLSAAGWCNVLLRRRVQTKTACCCPALCWVATQTSAAQPVV